MKSLQIYKKGWNLIQDFSENQQFYIENTNKSKLEKQTIRKMKMSLISKIVLCTNLLMIKIHIIILADLFHEELLFLFLLFQELLIIFILFILLLILNWELIIEHVLSFSLPRWIVHLWVHHFILLHFIHDFIDLVFIEELFDNLFMFWNISVHEIKTFCQDLHLVDNLLQLEWHYLWNDLNY